MSDARWRLVVDQQGVTIAGDRFRLTATAGPDGVPADPTVDDVLFGVAESGHVEAILHELNSMTRRSYGQYCGVARAQELLGERWALLILRDLTVSPKTVADLRRGLPRIPPEILTTRLEELERGGVILGEALPDDTVAYRLTEFGAELEDIVVRLSRWGARVLGQPRADEILTTDSLLVTMRAAFQPEAARGLRASYELRIGNILCHLRVNGGTLAVGPGPMPGADLVIEPGRSLTGLMSGEIDPIEAVNDGRVVVTGNPVLLRRFTTLFRIPASRPGRPARVRVRPESAVRRRTRRAIGDVPSETDDHMDEIGLRAVERAVATMRGHLAERLTIDDLARSAMFSKFHFTRVFQKITGVSPGRFLAALRLDEAKRLLVSTPLTVADISHQVGYSSVGTFSSRFRGSVGVAPTTYRQFGGVTSAIPTHNPDASTRVTVRGRVVTPPESRLGTIFVGLFPGRILEAPAVSYTMLAEPGPYIVPDVPAGSWYVLACSAPGPAGSLVTAAYIGCHGPLRIEPDITGRLADIQMRPMSPLDPPVLMALHDVRLATATTLAAS